MRPVTRLAAKAACILLPALLAGCTLDTEVLGPGVPGPQGPAGDAGVNGEDGLPGEAGTPGTPGTNSWKDGKDPDRVTTKVDVGIGMEPPEAPAACLHTRGTLSKNLGQVSVSAKDKKTVTGQGINFKDFGLAPGDAVKIAGETIEIQSITEDGSALTLNKEHSKAPVTEDAYVDPDVLFAIDNGAGTNKLTVTRGGDVGIGTTNPLANLHVKTHAPASGSVQLLVEAESPGVAYADLWLIASDNGTPGNGLIRRTYDGLLTLANYYGPSPPNSQFVLDTNGNVGIGTKGPTNRLQVGGGKVHALGTGLSTGFTLDNHQWYQSGTGPTSVSIFNAGGTDTLALREGNVGIGIPDPKAKLHVNGNILATGSITPGSSRDLKRDIRDLPAPEALAALLGLHPTRFRYKADPNDEQLGFIAEDVPELVATSDRKGVSPMDVAAVLTSVVQQQHETIAAQQGVIAAQQRRIATLDERLRRIEAKLGL
ncbi:MAG: tail fiber domain-containing protein [Deltaproteobacteria bacterium]|nr:tail fiber domain-containing protein [Deltaproteobacteria bacterium]